MSWKMIGDPKTRKLTRSLAEEFAGMTPAPHDRPLNATRSNVLRVAFEKERFRTCEWATAYCEQTKTKYRVNGKHTSTVLASMNGEFPKNLCVIIEDYHCDTMEDVASLYSTFDPKSSARSTGDINLIYSAVCPELNDISGRIVNVVVSGIAYSIWEESYALRPAEERAQLIISGSDFCIFVSEVLEGHSGDKIIMLRRASVVAAMFKCWQKSKTAAKEFWIAVRDETGSTPHNPDRKLAKFLSSCRLSSRKGTNAKIAGSREMYVKCLHAWNAWREDGTTDLKFYPNAKTPPAK